MANGQQEKPKEICTITIIFPIDSDDEAIEYKKKIGVAMADHSKARIDFRIMNMGNPRV